MNALKNTSEKGGKRGYYAETLKWICGITNDFWENDFDWTLGVSQGGILR